jgi:hypothetical protein
MQSIGLRYEALPIDIRTLCNDLGITVTVPTAA